jgi:hypothetical protein
MGPEYSVPEPGECRARRLGRRQSAAESAASQVEGGEQQHWRTHGCRPHPTYLWAAAAARAIWVSSLAWRVAPG